MKTENTLFILLASWAVIVIFILIKSKIELAVEIIQICNYFLWSLWILTLGIFFIYIIQTRKRK